MFVCEWIEAGKQQTGHATEADAMRAAEAVAARGRGPAVVWFLDDGLSGGCGDA